MAELVHWLLLESGELLLEIMVEMAAWRWPRGAGSASLVRFMSVT
jgi:hypothetical protein